MNVEYQQGEHWRSHQCTFLNSQPDREDKRREYFMELVVSSFRPAVTP
jgi:hypothetical protein